MLGKLAGFHTIPQCQSHHAPLLAIPTHLYPPPPAPTTIGWPSPKSFSDGASRGTGMRPRASSSSHAAPEARVATWQTTARNRGRK